MSLQKTLAALIRQGESADQAAYAALDEMPVADLRQLAEPIVVAEARRIYRSLTRRAEDAAFADGALSAPAARAALMELSFALPDGRMVAWSEATADEHRARAAWQRQGAAALVEDAVRHEAAATMIEAAGVSCLAELPESRVVSKPKSETTRAPSTRRQGRHDTQNSFAAGSKTKAAA